jgi:hypothetical protein
MRPIAPCLLAALLLAALPALADDGPAAGALWGTVTTRGGDEVAGFLRFDGGDLWWDDLFAADRSESEWADRVDLEEISRERRNAYFASHGLFERLAYALHDRGQVDLARRLVCHYGRLASITLGEDGAEVATTDGRRHAVRLHRGDLRGDLLVATAGGDSTELDFDRVTGIVFAAAPEGALPPWRRLRGRMTTARGPMQGSIQWDMSENCDLDILDGKDDDGDHDVPMGEIAALVGEGDATAVLLRDGNRLRLSGTNDVNDDNRGIVVMDDDGMRTVVPWKHFVRLDLDPLGASGPGRAAFAPGGPLTGTVTDIDGAALAGELAWDLDESRTWDLLDGEDQGWDRSIPFALIASLAPQGPACEVELKDGRRFLLDEGNDVDDDNAGVLVMGPGGDRRVPWGRIARVALDR